MSWITPFLLAEAPQGDISPPLGTKWCQELFLEQGKVFSPSWVGQWVAAQGSKGWVWDGAAAVRSAASSCRIPG